MKQSEELVASDQLELNMAEIHAFIGQIGAGKTFFALKEVKKHKSIGRSVLMISWADPIKQFLSTSFGLNKTGLVREDFDNFYKDISSTKIVNIFSDALMKYAVEAVIPITESTRGLLVKRIKEHMDELKQIFSNLNEHPEKYSSGYRRLIQLTGTEFGRAIDKNIWVEVVLSRIDLAFRNNIAQVVIIDDIRFENEYDSSFDFALHNNHRIYVYGVKSDIKTRAERTGMTVEQLEEFNHHASEFHVPKLIKQIPPNQIIQN